MGQLNLQKIQRIQGKKVRLWLKFNVGTVTPAGRYQVTQTGGLASAYAGNIINGRVPFPLYMTSVRASISPDFLTVSPANAGSIGRCIAESYFEIYRADQIKIFEFSMADCINIPAPVIGASSTSFVMDITSKEKKLEGSTQRFKVGDVCDVYFNLGYAPTNAGGAAIEFEINGYTE